VIAGSVYARDHWSLGDDIELDYGMRWDRYSYVAEAPNMFSPRAGLRARVVGGTSVIGELAQRMVAPGSTEFQPPSVAGPWLPPERTFLSLATSGAFRAERVRHAEIGVEQAFTRGAVALRRFRQASDDQTATLFGVNDGLGWSSGVYSVAAVGAMVADGWAVRAEGAPSSRLSGSLEYSIARATWLPGGSGSHRAQTLAPSVVRSGLERVHDLQASVDVHIPESSTDLAMTYRLNTAFSRAGGATTPGPGARFDMQVNQALPFQPVRGGRLEVLVAVSNLFRDSRQAGSIFDELLTVAPPLRILGGFQLRF
jgi:outer membrane receptor protein involved in Fe transport